MINPKTEIPITLLPNGTVTSGNVDAVSGGVVFNAIDVSTEKIKDGVILVYDELTDKNNLGLSTAPELIYNNAVTESGIVSKLLINTMAKSG